MDSALMENIPDGRADVVINIIAAYKSISPETITLTTSLEELGLNSLDAVTIAFDIEEALDITMNEGELMSFKTVSDIVTRIESIGTDSRE